MLPPDQYVTSLARKRMAATAFFHDDQGRVLLVNLVYRETWDLPGGAVEAEESPHAACRREARTGPSARSGACGGLGSFPAGAPGGADRRL